MGEAKQRKKRAERLKSQGMSQYNIEDLKKELNLPKEAQFLGYVVHLPDTDEFLHNLIENDMGVMKTIAKLPDMAMIFDDIELAIKATNEFNYKARVCLLFDVGSQYLVIGDDEIGNSF